jgi:hypothetical protein
MLRPLSTRRLVKLSSVSALLAAAALTVALSNGPASAARAFDPCVANPGGPYTGTVNQVIQFDGSASDDGFDGCCTNYVWNFGDGGGANWTMFPTHAYSAAGTYTVRLTMTNTHQSGLCTATTTATISN